MTMLTSQGQTPDVLLSLDLENKPLAYHAWGGWGTQQVWMGKEGQWAGPFLMPYPGPCTGHPSREEGREAACSSPLPLPPGLWPWGSRPPHGPAGGQQPTREQGLDPAA